MLRHLRLKLEMLWRHHPSCLRTGFICLRRPERLEYIVLVPQFEFLVFPAMEFVLVLQSEFLPLPLRVAMGFVLHNPVSLVKCHSWDLF